MFDATSAPSGLTDDSEYLGCTEAHHQRRACFDGRCAVRETCQLWTRRDEPGYATRCMTWRTHWLCFTEPCDFFKPTAQGNPHDSSDPGP